MKLSTARIASEIAIAGRSCLGHYSRYYAPIGFSRDLIQRTVATMLAAHGYILYVESGVLFATK